MSVCVLLLLFSCILCTSSITIIIMPRSVIVVTTANRCLMRRRRTMHSTAGVTLDACIRDVSKNVRIRNLTDYIAVNTTCHNPTCLTAKHPETDINSYHNVDAAFVWAIFQSLSAAIWQPTTAERRLNKLSIISTPPWRTGKFEDTPSQDMHCQHPSRVTM